MIILSANSINQVYVTCSELMSNTANKILFEFINEQDYNAFYSLTTGNTSTTGRYDQYQIQVTSSPVNLNAQVNLPTGGNYIYNCYEVSTNTLDPNQAIKKVETGRCLVIGIGDDVYINNENLYS